MVQSPQKHIDALHRSSSQSQGESVKSSNGLSPNAEAQQHAIQRYQRQLRSDPQLQVNSDAHYTLMAAFCSYRADIIAPFALSSENRSAALP